ncbi:MAG: hypothetical protein K9M49_04510 [Candidatus Marinimicrobia bacterium]|nr:hypothetical protein [Candidatus Neomarinimicrobiota bacterium]MCF7904399.1 hypothetical protein [Candidatus Neomarinimicrobiota bacterium]
MYIVAIMITAVVFSITGLGVLNLAFLVNLGTDEAARTIEHKIEAESAVNIALWKINSGADSLGTYTQGDLVSTFDSAEVSLTVSVGHAGGDTAGFKIYLERDHHFNHVMSSQYEILTYSYSTSYESDNRPRDNFNFLPIADESYWFAMADTIYPDNARIFQAGDLIEGIIVFTGTANKFQNINVENTTMVFSGGGEVEFRQSNTIKSARTDSTIYPALVFTDSTSTIYINETNLSRIDSVLGPIFSMGSIRIGRSALSGPIVGRDIAVIANVDFLDDEYPEYYSIWPKGFSTLESYDWPKQILRWEELY